MEVLNIVIFQFNFNVLDIRKLQSNSAYGSTDPCPK